MLTAERISSRQWDECPLRSECRWHRRQGHTGSRVALVRPRHLRSTGDFPGSGCSTRTVRAELPVYIRYEVGNARSLLPVIARSVGGNVGIYTLFQGRTYK